MKKLTREEKKKPQNKDEKGLHANLKKRGMKFAHVNITTLPGHYADAEVLMEKGTVYIEGGRS